MSRIVTLYSYRGGTGKSTSAVNLVKNDMRPQAHAAAPVGTYALVGGTTAVFADIQAAMNHDYAIVFPVAAVIILLILRLTGTERGRSRRRRW